MDDLRLLVDMNLSPLTAAALRVSGMDVVRVSDVLPANAPDEVILDLARRERRTVVTQDLDFSALVALGGHAQPSVVTLRLSAPDPESVTHRLLAVLPEIAADLRDGCAVTIDDQSVRIRHLPIE